MTYQVKRPRTYINGDPITNLPEDLVCEILSRLPTKDAVRTSILSKAWQHKWTSSWNFFVDKLPWRRPHKNISFINAMNQILHPANHLRSFQFRSSNFDDQSCFQAWIPVLLKHKLERFKITLNVEGNVYPSSLLNSTSLRKLRLRHFRSTLYVGGKNCAPNLTTICLSELNIVNDNTNSSTVKFDFPLLEKLSLLHVKWLNVKSVEISAPSLTTFKSGCMASSEWDDEFIITVVSPRLTRFVCSDGVPEVFITNGSSVVSAVLDYGDHKSKTQKLSETIALRVNNLVNGFTSLKELELSRFAAEALLSGPRFHGNVTRLWLNDRGSAEQLLALLHAMPSLKFLVVNVWKWKNYNYEAVETVPSCIVSQLEEVVFRFFNGKVPQYDLARFLSKNANQLKKLTVITDGSHSEPSTVREHLATFTRRSSKIEFDARAYIDQSEFGSYPYSL